MKSALPTVRTRFTLLLALVAVTGIPALVHAQSNPAPIADLAGYFRSSSQAIRSTYSRSWQLLLQRQPALAQITVDASNGVCLGRVANRQALGCDPTSPQCAAAAHAGIVREVVMAQADIVHGLRMINALPDGAAKADLLNQATFQSAVLRRTLANLVSDRGASQFLNFGTLTTRAPPAPAAPLPARVESGCEINDAQPVVLQSLPSAEALLGNTSVILFNFVSLSPNPDRAAICAPGVTPVGRLTGNPCDILAIHVAEIARRIVTGGRLP